MSYLQEKLSPFVLLSQPQQGDVSEDDALTMISTDPSISDGSSIRGGYRQITRIHPSLGNGEYFRKCVSFQAVGAENTAYCSTNLDVSHLGPRHIVATGEISGIKINDISATNAQNGNQQIDIMSYIASDYRAIVEGTNAELQFIANAAGIAYHDPRVVWENGGSGATLTARWKDGVLTITYDGSTGTGLDVTTVAALSITGDPYPPWLSVETAGELAWAELVDTPFRAVNLAATDEIVGYQTSYGIVMLGGAG